MTTRAGNDWTHIERTENEPRQEGIYKFKITSISTKTPTIKLINLSPTTPIPSFTYLPGQWVDLYINNITKPGGFTITSWPPPTLPTQSMVLAIQRAESNPVARWFWSGKDDGEEGVVEEREEVGIRVGGGFVYPPLLQTQMGIDKITDIVFVAGGVGVNPFIPMLQYMRDNSILNSSSTKYQRVSMLYSTRASSLHEIHFYEELRRIGVSMELFLTAPDIELLASFEDVETKKRRIELEDVLRHVEKGRKEGTLVYVCGPQGMTDGIVEGLEKEAGLKKEQVLCEKWW